MSVIIETLVQCDLCGANCSGDDRYLSAREIRRARKREGWIQVGSKDYCEKCVPQHKELAAREARRAGA